MSDVRFSGHRSIAALAGAVAVAALFAAPLAHADPISGARPTSCTAADLEGVRAGVDASTSVYLFTHPDLNTYMSSLQGQTREQVTEHVTTWLSNHPQEKAEMTGIRQPLVDLKNHCGAMPDP